MEQKGNRIYFCISVPALQSYKRLEPNSLIPSPQQRIEFLKRLYSVGICTILTIRPLCPNSFIPVSECTEIIKQIQGQCSAVISSGIVVDDYILKRLPEFPKNAEYVEKGIMSCLENDIKVKYINVDKELKEIENSCKKYNIPYFNNSLPAINYLYDNKK